MYRTATFGFGVYEPREWGGARRPLQRYAQDALSSRLIKQPKACTKHQNSRGKLSAGLMVRSHACNIPATRAALSQTRTRPCPCRWCGA